MFYVMLFYRNEFGNYNVRAASKRPCKHLNTAIKRVCKHNEGGYVKKIGSNKPVFQHII